MDVSPIAKGQRESRRNIFSKIMLLLPPPLLVVVSFSWLFLQYCTAAITAIPTTAAAAAVAAAATQQEERQDEDEEIVITDFERPECFYDLQGTPYILVSEYNKGSRSISTTIALLDTTKNGERLALSYDPNVILPPPSIFVNPSCTALPFEQLGAHGLDARPIMMTTTTTELWWEVAVVNHFQRESIEFYALHPSTRTVTSMGCVDLTTSSSGEFHNSVSFAPRSSDGIEDDDDLLAVTLFYETYYGIKGKIAFFSSFLHPSGGGDGALLLVRPGGDVSIEKDNLNGPNGVWFANDRQIFVAETPNEQVIVVDPETGEIGSGNTVVSVKSSPDNLNRFSNVEFLVTRVDSPLPQLAICFLLGIDAVCKLDLSVLLHNIETLQTKVIYSRSGGDSKKKASLPSYSGQPSAAIIKNGFLYIGNFQTNNLLRVRINI